MSIKQIFVELTMAFNNDEVMVTIPQDDYDLDNIDSLDPNDGSRIYILGDREYFYFILIVQQIWRGGGERDLSILLNSR